MEIFFSISEKLTFIVFVLLYSVGLVMVYNRLPLSWFMEKNDSSTDKSSILKKFPDIFLFVSIFTILSFVSFIVYGYSLWLVFLLVVLSFLLPISASDIKTGIIPDQFTFGLAFSSLFRISLLLFDFNQDGQKWYVHIIGAALGFLVGGLLLYLLNLLGKLIFGKEAIGMGDVKLLAAVGLLSGFSGIFKITALSFIFAFIPAIIGMAGKRKRQALPFAPYICAALLIHLVFPGLTDIFF